MALRGGTDGLLFYRSIPSLWKPALREGGWLLLEVGMGQHPAVEELLRQAGFCCVTSIPDLAGIYRVVLGKR
jgi:release factor glutamine methyltransferase